MKNQIKIIQKFLVITALALFLAENVEGQVKFAVKPSVLKTRWTNKVSPENALIEYPRPQMVRSYWISLNGLWEYQITKNGDPIPNRYEGEILVPYPIESALSGVKKMLLPDQNLWYKRTFNKPEMKTGEKLLLNFGAVDWQATVFVNGTEAGIHTGGYTAFSLDITKLLKKGKNELLVKVYDPTDRGIGPRGKQTLNPANIYYTPSSGIWQTVWLEKVPNVSIKQLTITPDVDKSLVNITVHSTEEVSVKLETDGKIIVGESNKIISIPIKDAKLWSPDRPYLYDLKVSLGKDAVSSYFGMRKIAIQKDEKGVDRIFLNNKYTYNLGTLDQGFWPDGLYTAPTDEALAFDIRAIKEMGFNTIRKHIKVEPARWYYHADKIGIMVWQDMVNPNPRLPEGSKQEFEKESEEILTQLHNYPSITTWVLFNEKWGQYDQERLTNWIKTSDPSRLVNGHSGEYLYVNNELRSPSPNAYIGADMTDVHSYPNPMLSLKQSGKAQICGEFGGIGVPVPSHQWTDLKGWGYIQVSPRTLGEKYAGMVDSLVKLEAQGLSGSIYTQPFDVESEENGLMTYDREIIKIPISKLRGIHSKLIGMSNVNSNFNFGKDIDPDDTDERYLDLITKFNAGKSDSSFLRRLTLMALRKQDQTNATKFGNYYIDNLKDKFETGNLNFIKHITRTSKDKGFEMFLHEPKRVNTVIGRNEAENRIKAIIKIENITPVLKNKSGTPDWDQLAIKLNKIYGELGSEEVYGSALEFYWNAKNDWGTFGKYYGKYFATAYGRSMYHINNFTWPIFEHVTDTAVLHVAINTMKYDIENFDQESFDAFDTYANLLHKIGRTKEAIEWEEKAARGKPNDKWVMETLQKMKQGIPTWRIN